MYILRLDLAVFVATLNGIFLKISYSDLFVKKNSKLLF